MHRRLPLGVALGIASLLLVAPIASSAPSSYHTLVEADKPSAYWRIDNDAGRVLEGTGHGWMVVTVDSFHGRDGRTDEGTHDPPNGRTGPRGGLANTTWGLAAFAEVLSRFTVGDTLDFAGRAPFTFEAWMKVGGSATDPDDSTVVRDYGVWPAFDKRTASGAGYRLEHVWASRGLRLSRSDGTAVDTLAVAGVTHVNQQHHVVGTYDGATLRLFVDGVSVGSLPSTLSLPDTTVPLVVDGEQVADSTRSYPWQLDEPAIYGHVLPASRIVAHSDGGRGPLRRVLLADGPAAYWSFDHGDVLDDSGNAIHFANASVAAGGLAGTARGMRAGSNMRQPTGSADTFDFAGNAPFTLETWARPTGADNTVTQRLVSKELLDGAGEQGWFLYRTASGFGLERKRDGVADTLLAGPAPQRYRTYHVVGTYDGATMRLYVDGVLAGSRSSSLQIKDITERFGLGAYSGKLNNRPFLGHLDEVAIYDKALPPETILDHANRGHSASYDRLVSGQAAAFWSLHDVWHQVFEQQERNPPIAFGDFSLHGETALLSGIDKTPDEPFDGIPPGTGVMATSLLGLNPADSFSLSPGDRFDFAGRAPFSVEAWVRPKELGSLGRRIFSKEVDVGPGWLLYGQNGGFGIQRRAGGTDQTTWDKAFASIGALPNRNYHVVGTYDGSNLRIWVNGVLRRFVGATKSLPDTTAPLRVGEHSNSRDLSFLGSIAMPAVYTRALTQTEIQQHYDLGA